MIRNWLMALGFAATLTILVQHGAIMCAERAEVGDFDD